MSDPKHTPLYSHHIAAQGKIVDFGGWALPVNYGSQIEEHQAVRNSCGMFDVSHMTVWDIHGKEATPFLNFLLANDVRKLADKPGKALYSCMLNEEGGVIDDLIVYHFGTDHYRVVTNAGTRDKVSRWMSNARSGFELELVERDDLALLAIQGPQAREKCIELLDPDTATKIAELKRFQGCFFDENFVGRTGYTGEDGFEFIVKPKLAQYLWDLFIDNGVQACGLGARDTLRLEAGMSLYGNDLEEQYTPIESGLSWTVSMSEDREFCGKEKLANPSFHMVGLVLIDKGVLREHQIISLEQQEIGQVTSGSFSPSLQKSIALARVNCELSIGQQVEIAVRKKTLRAEVVAYPFYKSN